MILRDVVQAAILEVIHYVHTLSSLPKLIDYAHKISAAKSSLKSMLLKNQCSGDMIFWNDNNFDVKNLAQL